MAIAGSSDQTTYLAHALSLAALHGPGPWPDGGGPLPDADPAPGRIQFASGALDGIVTHHTRGPAQASLTTGLTDLILRPDPNEVDRRLLHDRLAEVSTMDIADRLGEELPHDGPALDRIREAGRWLAEHGTRRGAVAAGIVLLGLAGDARDRDLLVLLGTLEELTLYAAVALQRSQPDREQAVYQLARRVDGWGRIQTVERLRATQDPEIRAWLLRGGFRNSIMDEYLAHLAATTGGLLDALTEAVVDDELFDNAGALLTALGAGGPAEDMGDYPDGPAAVDRYLTLAAARPPTLAGITVIVRLNRDIAESAAAWGWPDDIASRLRAGCERLTARPQWRAVVEGGLADPDPEAFRLASWLGVRLSIPGARERIADQLRRTPDDTYLWFTLMDNPGAADDAGPVVALGEELLPLDELATGPSTDVGHFDGPDGVLDILVSRLDRHPGRGWSLIRVALANRMIRNRNMAIKTLTAWPATAIPDAAVDAVRAALQVEPDQDVRASLRRLLRRLTDGDGRSG
jgi:hypothetical protein